MNRIIGGEKMAKKTRITPATTKAKTPTVPKPASDRAPTDHPLKSSSAEELVALVRAQPKLRDALRALIEGASPTLTSAPRKTMDRVVTPAAYQTAKAAVAEGLAKANSIDDVKARSGQLPTLAASMATVDICETLGGSAADFRARFNLPAAGVSNARLAEALESAHTELKTLSKQVFEHLDGANKLTGLGRLQLGQTAWSDMLEQHVGYATTALSEEPTRGNLTKEALRHLLRAYFKGDAQGRESPVQTREALASETKRLSGSEAAAAYIMAKDNDRVFDRAHLGLDPPGQPNPAFVLANHSSALARAATRRFAAALVGNDRKAASLIQDIFNRPTEDLVLMLGAPHGIEGAVLHFAASAHHMAWSWAKLATATAQAHAGDEGAKKSWNNADLVSTRGVRTKRDHAVKLHAQVEAGQISDGTLVPCERGEVAGAAPVEFLRHIRGHGPWSEQTRVASSDARSSQVFLQSQVRNTMDYGDVAIGAMVARDSIARVCGSYAAHAMGAPPEEHDDVVRLFQGAIRLIEGDLNGVIKDERLSKDDEAYKALYQTLAGRHGCRALVGHLGEGAAAQLVRTATFGHFIDGACDQLDVQRQDDWTPEQMVKDVVELKEIGLLKDDYFLQSEEQIEALLKEGTREMPELDRAQLETAVRIPNVIWLYMLAVRGRVESKQSRLIGGPADKTVDTLPDNVQFNPPELRDAELYEWARHRLEERGMPPAEASRKAMALVVFTQYKDLLQLRKNVP
jgi:hypothetical protein